MAVVATKNPSGLKIRFDCGTDEITGKVKTKSKTYSNVRPSASGDEIYAVGKALSGLQKHDLLEIARVDNTTLSE